MNTEAALTGTIDVALTRPLRMKCQDPHRWTRHQDLVAPLTCRIAHASHTALQAHLGQIPRILPIRRQTEVHDETVGQLEPGDLPKALWINASLNRCGLDTPGEWQTHRLELPLVKRVGKRGLPNIWNDMLRGGLVSSELKLIKLSEPIRWFMMWNEI
jgi:hypothetical protein